MTIVTCHNVVGLNGKSCCPTKAGLQCNKCGRTGHFAKYCTASNTISKTVDKFLEKYREPEVELKTVIKPVAKAAAVSSVNPYAGLEETSDEESPRTPSKSKAETECPWAPEKAVKPQKPKPVNWADWSDSDDEE
jgi:hypothetical protein